MNENRHLEISAVIPAYNEAKNILWVLTSILKNLAAFRKIKELAYSPTPSKRTRKAMGTG